MNTINTLFNATTKSSGKPLCIYCLVYLFWYGSIHTLLLFELWLSMSTGLKMFVFKISLVLKGYGYHNSLVVNKQETVSDWEIGYFSCCYKNANLHWTTMKQNFGYAWNREIYYLYNINSLGDF